MDWFNGLCIGIGVWFSFWFFNRDKKPRNPYSDWMSITKCKGCGSTKEYCDQYPTDPCTNCGGKVVEMVGRFDFKGNHWEVKEKAE